tara:strand:+ start:846 stop:1667 length:822 start_codon:yes stop_codon:yes gene_type:complete
MTKQVDVLEEDPVIQAQKFACVSFISPENIIKQKELFMFEKFLNNWDLNKSMEKFSDFLSFISYKYKIDNQTLTSDFESFTLSEQTKFQDYNCNDDFLNFMDKNESKLENEFSTTHDFQTNIRGLKIRGVFETQEQAESRCKLLRDIDSHHDVYVGPVGTWIPWHPESYKTNRVEYMESELNGLMHEKLKNEKKAKEEFDARVMNTKKDAIRRNTTLAESTGNKLTQNIDTSGNLVDVRYSASDTLSVADIEKELFDKSEVRLKNDKEIKMKT